MLQNARIGDRHGTFSITAAAPEAPEPASFGLILLGGLGAFAARRKFAKN